MCRGGFTLPVVPAVEGEMDESTADVGNREWPDIGLGWALMPNGTAINDAMNEGFGMMVLRPCGWVSACFGGVSLYGQIKNVRRLCESLPPPDPDKSPADDSPAGSE